MREQYRIRAKVPSSLRRAECCHNCAHALVIRYPDDVEVYCAFDGSTRPDYDTDYDAALRWDIEHDTFGNLVCNDFVAAAAATSTLAEDV